MGSCTGQNQETNTMAQYVNLDDEDPPCDGPVAQLGARFHGMEEVIGSNPIRSTNVILSIDSMF
jgi:hypothetical protein